MKTLKNILQMEMLMCFAPVLFVQGWAGIRKYSVFDQEASDA